jgi:GNAT superfamily N-acetyltransferase
MPEAALAQWRAARAESGAPLPEESDGVVLEPLLVTVGGVEVGGAVVAYDDQGGRSRAVLRTLQTTLAVDAPEWAAVLAVVEARVRERGVRLLTTAVPPDLVAPFQAAGFKATMTSVSKRLDPESAPELQEDRRVAVRPMDPDERLRFAGEVAGFLRSGMERSGVLAGDHASVDEIDERVAAVAGEEPPAGELLMMGLVDGVPVGRAWATLVTAEDGSVDFLGNTIDLFPEFRGQGLTRSFLGALRRHVKELGVRDVHLRVYAHDTKARRTFIESGAGVDDVHLRKDLG